MTYPIMAPQALAANASADVYTIVRDGDESIGVAKVYVDDWGNLRADVRYFPTCPVHGTATRQDGILLIPAHRQEQS